MKYYVDGIAFKKLNLILESGINLCEYGYEDFQNRRSNTRKRKISTHVLQFVVRGEGQYFIKDNIFDLNENTLFYLPPNIPLKYQRRKSNPYKYFWITLQGKNVIRLLQNFGITADNPVKHFQNKDLFPLFNSLESMELTQYKLKAICFDIFNYLQDQSEPQKKFVNVLTRDDLSERLKNYIHANFSNPNLSILEITNTLGISETQLYRLSISTLGMSAKKYLLSYRMKHAVKLLKLGYNATDTSAHCGFADLYYFSKEFKKKYGIPPSQYKKQKIGNKKKIITL